MTTMTAIVDLQFGSTGKGLIAGYLSQRNRFDTVVSANMPNAGHTFVDAAGRKTVNKVLPSGVYSPTLERICIGPGAVFSARQLALEINEFRQNCYTRPRFMIHEAAAILFPYHAEAEKKLNPISSTMQGSMEASVEKMRRNSPNNTVGFNGEYLDGVKTDEGESLSQFIVSAEDWQREMLLSQNILCEGSQGYSLGINAGFYPYCTSRDCTVWRLMSDCALPAVSQRTVIGTCRVHPIRVGNTEGGTSGPGYADQEETTWEAIGVEPEYTTVTRRVRRVFTFSERQIYDAVLMNGVDQVFLNFCNYNPKEAIRVMGAINAIGARAFSWRGMGAWNDEMPEFVRYLGFGPQSDQIMEVRGWSA